MWKNKEQPVVKTGKMCRIAQNYEHDRALPLHAVRWLGIMIDSQNKCGMVSSKEKMTAGRRGNRAA